MKYTVSLVLLAVLGLTRAQNVLELEMTITHGGPNLTKRVSDDMLKKCIDNGDTQALERARAAGTKGEQCFSSAEDHILYMVRANNETARQDVEERCGILSRHILNCTESFHADVYPCYSDQDIAFYNVTQQMGKNLINYICGPELNIFALTRTTTEDKQCYQSAVRNMTDSCKKPLMESEDENADIFRRVLEPRVCRKVKQAIDCIVRHLEVCIRPSEYTSVDVAIGGIIAMASAIPPCPEETSSNTDNVL